MTPQEPPGSRFRFDVAKAPAGQDLVGVGADLAPGTLLAAYRAGLFPMGVAEVDAPDADSAAHLGWWSPDPRGVLPLTGLRVSRSLRKATARFEVTVDQDFDEVVHRCAAPDRSGRWITSGIAAAYGRLHRLGWAHSVECRLDGALVGGLYGVGIAGLFAGESMFHEVTDASKVALVHLVRLLRADGDPRRLLDVQWRTEHLASLGVVEVPREQYLGLLQAALGAPEPDWTGPVRG